MTNCPKCGTEMHSRLQHIDGRIECFDCDIARLVLREFRDAWDRQIAALEGLQ